MTKTIASATDTNKKYFIQVEQDTAVSCTCKGFQYRSRCHHLVDFNAEVQKAQRFIALREQLDVRSEVQKAARRERYCIEFNIY